MGAVGFGSQKKTLGTSASTNSRWFGGSDIAKGIWDVIEAKARK